MTEQWNGQGSLERIKELMALKVPISQIAKRFGVSRQAIYDVLKKEQK